MYLDDEDEFKFDRNPSHKEYTIDEPTVDPNVNSIDSSRPLMITQVD